MGQDSVVFWSNFAEPQPAGVDGCQPVVQVSDSFRTETKSVLSSPRGRQRVLTLSFLGTPTTVCFISCPVDPERAHTRLCADPQNAARDH